MEAGMAFITIIAIVAIVLVAGGLIAFIGHMVIGVFDGNKKPAKQDSREVIDYSQYKQLEDVKGQNYSADYNFEAINESKALKEKAMVEKEKDTIFELEEDKDAELEAIEQRLKESIPEIREEVKAQPVEQKVLSAVEQPETEDLDDDFDLDEMLSEISDEVIEEEKAETETELNIGDELASYNIDEMLQEAEEEENLDLEEIEESSEDEEEVEEEIPAVEEVEEEIQEIPAVEDVEEIAEIEDIEDEEENIDLLLDEIVEDEIPEEEIAEDEEVVEEKVFLLPDVNPEIERLKAQLAELNRQLEEARTAKVEVVKIDITEEECIQKIEILEERLKNVKKDYKTNMKEYRPLKKVMTDLERYQTKLRRKEAVVAKKKVALYGVNNYVDIDKEKAEKLANELELLDGLRLSVGHCEEVINANKDRFPILEHTNQILEDQISHLEADLASAQETLKKIRGRNGNGNNEGSSEE